MTVGGLVGIGTFSPAARLEVLAANSDGIRGTSTGTSNFGIVGTNWSNIGIDGNGGLFGVRGYAGGLGVADSVACCVTGVIGTGENAHGVAIGVGGYVNAPNGWGTQGLNQGGGIGVLAQSRGGTGLSGIGLYAESDSGSAIYAINLGTGEAGTFKGNISVEGNAFKSGGGSWSVLSDLRLKKSIEPISDPLGRLLRLRGTTYEYTDPTTWREMPGTHIGMVAQEVEPIFPSWVDTGNDGYKRVTFRGFEALTVEAVRELNERFLERSKQVTAQITALEQLNDELRKTVDALSAALRALQERQR